MQACLRSSYAFYMCLCPYHCVYTLVLDTTIVLYVWVMCRQCLLSPSCRVTQIFQNFVQQSNEKIDRTRGIACEKLMSLLHSQKYVQAKDAH